MVTSEQIVLQKRSTKMTTVIQSPVLETVTSQRMTLAEFLASPESDQNYEFIDGQAIRKMSPKRFHASL